MSEIKPGSAYETDPKIVLGSMLKCPLQFPHRSRMEDVVSLRSKFSVVFNEVANEFQCSVLDLQSCDECHFDLMGKLNQFGMFTYWKELNHYIKLFDKKMISLAPITHEHAGKSKSHSAHCTDRRSEEYHRQNYILCYFSTKFNLTSSNHFCMGINFNVIHLYPTYYVYMYF